MASSEVAAPLPLLASLGVLSDIQYANEDDGHNFLRTERRYYRHALVAAGRAIERMRGGGGGEWRCDGVLHLGDLLDGFNRTKDPDPARPKSEAALKAIMAVLPPPATSRIVETRRPTSSSTEEQEANSASAAALRCYHLLGNHELINFPRSRWARELGMGALSEQSRLEAAARDTQATSAAGASEATAAAADAAATYQFPTHSPDTSDPLVSISDLSISAPAPVAAAADSSATASAAETVYTSTSPLYYDILVADRFRLIMLDAFDIGVSGYEDMPAAPAATSDDGSASAAAAAAAASPSVASPESAAEAAAESKGHVHGHSGHSHGHAHGGHSHNSRQGHGHRHGHHGRHHHHHRDLARAFLLRENPNDEKYSPEGLEGTERRKVAYNGGMGSAQLLWLRSVLRDCVARGQHAVLLSHVAFHEGCSHCSALLWNRAEVLDIVAEFADTVVACLHGHDHDGGHCIDAQTAVVHHTFEGLLTSPEGSDTFGRIDFFADRIQITGVDRMKSFTIPLGKEQRKQAAAEAAATAATPVTAKGLAKLPTP